MNYENEMYFELSRIDFLYGLKKKGHVKIYQEAHTLYSLKTDDGETLGTGDKGYGIVLADKKKRRLAYLAVKCRENTASSALLEIAAIVKALDFVLKDHRPHHLIIHTDFLATVRLFQEKDFLKALASYPEDFQELARRVAYWKYQPNVTLEIKKVKAHAGKCGNEEADALAKLGALGKN